MMNKKKLPIMMLLCILLIPTAFVYAQDPPVNCDEYADENWLYVRKNPDPAKITGTDRCNIDDLWYAGKKGPKTCVPVTGGHLVIPGSFSGTTNQGHETYTNHPVNGIDNDAFSYDTEAGEQCPAITSVWIPDGIRIIDEKAFKGTALTAVSIPGNVELIKSTAFGECKSLEEVTFESSDNPDNPKIQQIADSAFINCVNLKRITIPEMAEITVSEYDWESEDFRVITYEHGMIGPDAFKNCSDLAVIQIAGDLPYLDSESFGWDTSEEGYYKPSTRDTRVILCSDRDCYDAAVSVTDDGAEAWSRKFGIAQKSQIAIPLPEDIVVTVKNAKYTGAGLTPDISVTGTEPTTKRVVYYDQNGDPYYDGNKLAESLKDDAGTYTIDIFIMYNDVNYYRQAEWTIEPGDQPTLTVSIDGWAVGEAPNYPGISDTPKGNPFVDFLYSSDNGSNWSKTQPSAAGDYLLKAEISGDPNYLDYTTPEFGFTISPKDPLFTRLTGSESLPCTGFPTGQPEK